MAGGRPETVCQAAERRNHPQGCKARESAISTARNWWLRSPNPSNANNERNVNTDGSLNNNNAYNGNGAVADCEDERLK